MSIKKKNYLSTTNLHISLCSQMAERKESWSYEIILSFNLTSTHAYKEEKIRKESENLNFWKTCWKNLRECGYSNPVKYISAIALSKNIIYIYLASGYSLIFGWLYTKYFSKYVIVQAHGSDRERRLTLILGFPKIDSQTRETFLPLPHRMSQT